jgi:hypothetical protein
VTFVLNNLRLFDMLSRQRTESADQTTNVKEVALQHRFLGVANRRCAFPEMMDLEKWLGLLASVYAGRFRVEILGKPFNDLCVPVFSPLAIRQSTSTAG